MTDKQKKLLADILNTLNAISVNGETNLNLLLGCMNALKDLLKEETDGNERTKP